MTPKTKGKGKGAKAAKAVLPKAPKLPKSLVSEHVAYSLITCIIERGIANKVAHAAMEAGAAGATILPARGMGLGQLMSALGHGIVPQKEVLMIVTTRGQSRRIFEVVSKAAELEKMGKGIAWTTPLYEMAGVMEATQAARAV